MKFIQDPHNLANNNYNTVLLFDGPGEICTEDEVTIESSSASTLEPITQDDANKVIDLTDDSETTVIQQLEFVPYNTNNNEMQFPTNLFVNIAPEWMEDLLQDIDGMMIYKIKCLPREWVHKSQDLRYIKMYFSKRKDLIGTRKVERCIRNLYCPYDDCSFNYSANGKGTHSTSRMWLT